MSAPPPGFNEQASNLPDPGAAAAPIHVMRGGGGHVPQVGGFGKDDEQILEDFGLNDPKITQHISNFDDSFKESFLTQFRSGKCSSKEMSVTRKDCWAVTAVIRATILTNFAKGNSVRLPGMVPENGSEVGATDNTNELPEGVARALNEAEEEDIVLAPCIREESDVSNRDSDMSNNAANKETKRARDAAAFSDYLAGRAPLPGTESGPLGRNYRARAARAAARRAAGEEGTALPPTPVAANPPTVAPPPVPTPAASPAPGAADAAAAAAEAARVAVWSGQRALSMREARERAAAAAAPAPAPAPAPAAVLINPDDFLENPANFRKGQYGINLNTRNNSKRVYANVVVGTKRMRIRGRNAANIKSKYNSKMQTLKNAVKAASSAAEQARKVAREATEARIAVEEARKAEDKRRKAAEQARKVEAKTAQSASRAAEVAALQARRAAGEKLSFMNRLRSVKNPFKRGGSRKTRRSTRRNRRR